MNPTFHVIPSLKQEDTLLLHPETARRLGLDKQRVGYVRFGARVVDLYFEQSEQVGELDIVLPIVAIEALALPLSCAYELLYWGDELEIGPFLGILAATTHERLERNVSALSNTVIDYHEINGAVVAFSAEGLDAAKGEVRGFVYDPEAQSWEEGRFGLPGAVFRRVSLSREQRRQLRGVLGSRVFNDYHFDKWEMYEWLRAFPAVENHLPETLVLEKAADLRRMLKRHGSVFVKPIVGSQGIGVMKATMQEDLRVAISWEEEEQRQEVVLAVEELEEFLQERRMFKTRLVQEALSLLKVEEQVVDFRLMLLKNGSGEWETMGIVGRMGIPGSVVSNISQGGRAELAAQLLGERLGWREKWVRMTLLQMEDLAVATAKSLETCGVHMGNLGLDLALDQGGRLWLLEVNNVDPNHTIAIDAGERSLFYRIKKTNLLYAKWLAGFAAQGEERGREGD